MFWSQNFTLGWIYGETYRISTGRKDMWGSIEIWPRSSIIRANPAQEIKLFSGMSGEIELSCRYDVASGAQEVEEIERRGVPNLGEKETWYVFINWSTHQPIGLIISSWLPVPASLPPVDLVLASGIASLLYSCYFKAGESSRKAWIPRRSSRLLTYPYATSRSSNVAVVHISFVEYLLEVESRFRLSNRDGPPVVSLVTRSLDFTSGLDNVLLKLPLTKKMVEAIESFRCPVAVSISLLLCDPRNQNILLVTFIPAPAAVLLLKCPHIYECSSLSYKTARPG